MTTPQLLEALTAAHEEFAGTVEALDANDFLRKPPGKWNAGQHLDHILRGVSRVGGALKLPGMVQGWLFGKTTEPAGSYEELVARYQQVLAGGFTATESFLPDEVGAAQQRELPEKLRAEVARLTRRAAGYSEAQLDTHLLPHPALGKLTLRQMLYFTLYHVRHHQRLVLRGLGRAER
ncbi:DinB family protein [Hymenobacter chitinivorans]|uniref:DinB family protein n=1 Tax=Hymenobacter chitinivorans DSM 11115 TaxID=1121954 RepID=A0A2M9BKZ1_9BACT|nr:DinB family protein [Hymenobacter chitinivorans]PJJ58601.1 DinB family protein [Hymenobacter chitinivorans DSM 11115]